MKKTKANNYGKGFYYEFADGTRGWIMGLSAQEKKVEMVKHGKLVKWIAA